MLTKEQILAAIDSKIEKVPVPEWGGDVYVKTMTGKDRDAVDSLVSSVKGEGGYPGLRVLICALCICDETGKTLFSRADVSELEKKNAVVLNRIFDAASELNGMTPEAARKAKESFPDAGGTPDVVPAGVADGNVGSGGTAEN